MNLLAAIAGCACFGMSLVHTAAADQPVRAIETVAWLEGCWEHQAGARTVEERWMGPRAGTMLGMGRTVQGDALIEYELVLIRERDGRLAYEAHPSGQPAGIFHAKTRGSNEVVFENLQHDFPQRIGYKRNGDALLAWIEGERNGQSRRIEFPYRRIACGER